MVKVIRYALSTLLPEEKLNSDCTILQGNYHGQNIYDHQDSSYYVLSYAYNYLEYHSQIALQNFDLESFKDSAIRFYKDEVDYKNISNLDIPLNCEAVGYFDEIKCRYNHLLDRKDENIEESQERRRKSKRLRDLQYKNTRTAEQLRLSKESMVIHKRRMRKYVFNKVMISNFLFFIIFSRLWTILKLKCIK